jgi:hypothetical protein
MNFEHHPYQFEPIERVTIDGKRRYITPEGFAYPSVTTVLGERKSEGLKAWIASVGEEVANKRKTQGANRGTALHNIYECFLNNDLTVSDHDPITYNLFKNSIGWLQQGLTKVHNLEFAVWSDRLQTAGTCDNLCEWEGVKSVLDYKTSFKPKKEEWVTDYFIQEATYAMCVYERIGLKVPQIVTFIVNEQDPEPQVFVRKTEDYIGEAIKIFKDYSRVNPI